MNTRIVVPGTVRLGDLAVKADAQRLPVAQATANTANQAIADPAAPVKPQLLGE